MVGRRKSRSPRRRRGGEHEPQRHRLAVTPTFCDAVHCLDSAAQSLPLPDLESLGPVSAELGVLGREGLGREGLVLSGAWFWEVTR